MFLGHEIGLEAGFMSGIGYLQSKLCIITILQQPSMRSCLPVIILHRDRFSVYYHYTFSSIDHVMNSRDNSGAEPLSFDLHAI